MFDAVNYDYCKSYKTLDNLKSALEKLDIDEVSLRRALPIIIPTGKNAGRYTAVFPAHGGENCYIVHLGFMIFG